MVLLAIILLSPLREMLTADQLTLLIGRIQSDPLGPVYYVLLYIICVIFALPGVMLTVFAGPIFGLWKGILLVIIGANIGCQITFLLARFLGKDFVYKFVKAEGLVARLSKKIESNGFFVILFLRLVPIFPFNIINYVSGLTSLRYGDYTLGTLLGMLPGTCMYVYLSYSAAGVQDNPWGLLIALGVVFLFMLVIGMLKKKVKLFGKDTEND